MFSPSTNASDTQELADFIQDLAQNPDREAVASEIEGIRFLYIEASDSIPASAQIHLW